MTGHPNSPLVSVLITVYNRETYLAGCIESVLASAWTDFEVIVVDDASTDGSREVADSLAAKDERLLVFRNKKNLGDYGNRMRAAELANGRYLKYVDSDDIIYPYALGAMVAAMQAYPDAALGLSHSDTDPERPYPWHLAPAAVWRKEFLGNGCLGCGPSGTIIRRDAFLSVGGFRNFGVVNDTDLWYRLSARWPVVLLPPALVWWRRHPGQEFTSSDAQLSYLEKGFDVCLDALSNENGPLGHAERTAAIARAHQRQARRLLSLALRSRRPRDAFRLMRSSRLTASDIIAGFRPYR